MNTLTKPILSLALTILFSTSVVSCKGQTLASSQISQSDLLNQIETKTAPLILDVRSPEEYAQGHIPGAVNINFKELGERIKEIDSAKNKTVVIYCERGIRAKVAELTLKEAGFKSILHLQGNIRQWRQNSLPLVKN